MIRTKILVLGSCSWKSNGGLNPFEHAAADGVLAGFAVVEKIGGREEARDRLHAARGLVDRVLGVLVARVAGRSLHQRQVPAGRSAGDADPVGVDRVVLGMKPDEPDGPVHVLHDLGNREPGLAAVDDGEDRVAALEQLGDEPRVDRIVRREPASADDPDDGRPVGVGLGREDVHRERRAELAAVDHVDLAVERGLVIRTGDDGHDSQKAHRKRDRTKANLSTHGVSSGKTMERADHLDHPVWYRRLSMMTPKIPDEKSLDSLRINRRSALRSTLAAAGAAAVAAESHIRRGESPDAANAPTRASLRPSLIA